MHHTLSIPEILELIFEELQCPHPDKRYGRNDFAALARTCKTFQDLALDLLWSEQDTLDNILQCLPAHLWEVEPLRRITGPIQRADWERPLEYAHRIRTLSLWSSNSFPNHEVLEALSSGLARPEDYWCTNLRNIAWFPGDDSLFPYIRLFLAPKITGARLTILESAVTISLLPTLLRYPDLKNLNISYVTLDRDASSLLCRTVSTIAMGLDRIEELGVHKLDRKALKHLSQLPVLETLCLYSPELEDLGPSSNSANMLQQIHPFPALRILRLSRTTLNFVIEFLDLLSDCHCGSFDVSSDALPTKSTTDQLYAALASHLSRGTLQTLDIGSYNGMPAPGVMDNYVINGQVLAPLFGFVNLTSLELQLPVGLDIDDATAWDMARAWMKLDYLSFTGVHHSSSMTLHGLSAFAKYCKDLAYLKITINASTVPAFDDSPDPPFHLGPGAITDPPTVTRFLSGLFPNLIEIKMHADWRWEELNEIELEDMVFDLLDRVHYNRWKQVEEFLPMVAAVGQEEQRWAWKLVE
ncbi:hypothetical protein DFH07DRAFT_740456 [Mycena maculata]|uniref:F-box domain-containing protein n=1 Tax=Mycena maculata TaxID=230809 RepID=A0AAD7JB17_9AGAR|nr:hypothetical protein DFH07DRAFT_740456 [Mycena maculata]